MKAFIRPNRGRLVAMTDMISGQVGHIESVTGEWDDRTDWIGLKVYYKHGIMGCVEGSAFNPDANIHVRLTS